MLKPVNTTIFVRPDEPILKRGALFLGPTDTRQSHGIVLQSSSPLCKPGDRIAYTRFFPTTVAGEDFIIVDQKDIFGVDDSPMPINGEVGTKPVSKQTNAAPILAPAATLDLN